MRKKGVGENAYNLLLSAAAAAVIWIFVSLNFDYYYELNDDILIKDILSGVYTGNPQGHTNQLLYPLDFFLSGMYRIFPKTMVFGIFLTACFILCFVLIGYRSLSLCKAGKSTAGSDGKGEETGQIHGLSSSYAGNSIPWKRKTAILILEGGLFLTVYLWEMVYMQYTVASGILAGCACFWFLTIPDGLGIKEFWKQALPALFLAWLSFLVRSEMLLLMCPFLAAAGGIRWWEECKYRKEENKGCIREKIFSRENLLRYLLFAGIFAGGLGVFCLADSLAYRTPEWKEYRQFFDARTRVYDYTWYPDYESGKQFYDENGITKEQYQLIHSYNFGLDPSIDHEMLEKIADYGEKQRVLGTVGTRVRNVVWELSRNLISKDRMPYNIIAGISYCLVLLMAILQKRKELAGQVLLLLAARTVSWSYLLWSARVPDRVAHPLYMTEWLILWAILLKGLSQERSRKSEKYYRITAALIYLAFAAAFLPGVYGKVRAEQQTREEISANQELLDDYCKKHGENYYYLDVYSSVSFAEKVYKGADNDKKNYDILGGWLCHSPLQEQAVKEYMTSVSENLEAEDPSVKEQDGQKEYRISEALLEDNFYFVAESAADTEFLTDFYKAEGKKVVLQLQAVVGEGENPFLVYKVTQILSAERL